MFDAGRAITGEEHEIPARYTCDGSDLSPPMSWTGVPAGTAELVLIVFDLTASTRRFDWAVAGLNPTLRGVSPGKLPTGAVVGRNGLGQPRYWVCPPKGQPHHYAVILYALQHGLSLRPGFDPIALYEKIGDLGLPQAQSGFVYQRR